MSTEKTEKEATITDLIEYLKAKDEEYDIREIKKQKEFLFFTRFLAFWLFGWTILILLLCILEGKI